MNKYDSSELKQGFPDSFDDDSAISELHHKKVAQEGKCDDCDCNQKKYQEEKLCREENRGGCPQTCGAGAYPYQQCTELPIIVKNTKNGLSHDHHRQSNRSLSFSEFVKQSSEGNYDGICKHKPLVPFYTMDFVGTLVLIVIMALATMGGIGGGGVVILLIE